VPAFVLVGLLVAAVALVVVAAWLGVRLRGRGDRASRAVQAVLAGLAVMFGFLVLAGMRHYGGTAHTPHAQADCGPWWQEAGLPASRRAQPGDLSPTCRQDAIDAIWPGVGLGAAVGAAAGLVVFGVAELAARSRRGQRAAGRAAVTYVDTDL